MAARKKPARKRAAKRPAVKAHRGAVKRKVGTRDSHGVLVRSKKRVSKMSAAKKKAYKSRTTKTGPVYLYDREQQKYVKTSQSGALSKKGNIGTKASGARYHRVSERTYNAGVSAGKNAHRHANGSTGGHTPRVKTIKKRKAATKAGRKNSKWQGKKVYAPRRTATQKAKDQKTAARAAVRRRQRMRN